MTFQITELSHIALMVFKVDAGVTLTKQDWQDLAQATLALDGFWTLVQQRVGLSQHKWSPDFKEAVLRLDLNHTHKAELIAKLNERAALYGITGNVEAKAAGVLLAELRDGAMTGLGYSQNAANKLLVAFFKLFTVVDGAYQTAMNAARDSWYAYRAANSEAWPVEDSL